MTRTRAFVLALGLVLAVTACGTQPGVGGGGNDGGGNTTDAGGNGNDGGHGGTNDGGNGGTTDGGNGGTTDGGGGGSDGGVTDGGNGGTDGGVTDGGNGGTDGGVTDGGTTDGGTADGGTTGGHVIKTVFMILMENHNWADIQGSSSAPYINSLLSQAAYATNYHNPPGNHPSEPNYIWLEAGSNLGITNDNDPSSNEKTTTQHLVTLLHNAGITWRAYEEGISGNNCPLTGSGNFAPKHDAMLFFSDSTGNLNSSDAYCIAHQRPYSELAGDLQNNTVAQYNFITPDLCDDMHNSFGCNSYDEVKNGDTWLSNNLPAILSSQAYQNGGLVIITWDESELDSTCSITDYYNNNCTIGLIVLSPYAKAGYSNSIHYDHSSTLKTVEEIFGVTPLLGHAGDASTKDLSDLFTQFP